mmetsp:Transcript_39892/g.96233  ORF Transcript_39892/g.96233 Transcript_39892/m.96233 type:complete len:284 (-) Transcript_39892:146-997(-)
MPSFMVGCQLQSLLRHHCTLALRPHHDPVLGKLQILKPYNRLVVGAGLDGRNIDHVGQVRPRETRRPPRDDLDVHAGRKGHVFEVQLEDCGSAPDVGVRNDDVAIEPPWASEGLVQHLGEVCCRNDNDALCRVEAVHLRQQLVQSHPHVLLVLGVARGANRVDLVDEYDAGRLALRRVEQVTHPPGAHAHEHLLEFAARRVEKGHTRLASNGLGEQCLSGPGGAHEEYALCHLAAQPREPLGVLEEGHNLHQLLLCLVDADDVLEGLGAVARLCHVVLARLLT